MSLSVDQLQVTSFETTTFEAAPLPPYTPPVPNCYSPLCMPTALPDQCPETTKQQTVVTEAK